MNEIERKLAQEPIELPGNPFWDVFKTFGRDELIALGISSGGTAAIENITSDPFLLAITGPVIEKVGFFVAHAKEAFDVYQTTPSPKREPVLHYTKRALRRGFSSLGKDVLVHDPIYTSSMYWGLQAYPDTPAWMLSMLTFIGAVGIVAIGEVALNEVKYKNMTRSLKKTGFGLEPYLESRFYIADCSGEELLKDLSQTFNLGTIKRGRYHDRYFSTNLKSYNFRSPVVRLRERAREGGDGKVQTLQVVYTRTSEMSRKNPEQFNYYPTRKDKFWAVLEGEMPWDIGEIKAPTLTSMIEKIVTGQTHDIYFTRNVAYDLNSILVSTDRVFGEGLGEFTVLEMKAYLNKNAKATLIEAMRYVMLKYPVIQTTHSKKTLTSLENALPPSG